MTLQKLSQIAKAPRKAGPTGAITPGMKLNPREPKHEHIQAVVMETLSSVRTFLESATFYNSHFIPASFLLYFFFRTISDYKIAIAVCAVVFIAYQLIEPTVYHNPPIRILLRDRDYYWQIQARRSLGPAMWVFFCMFGYVLVKGLIKEFRPSYQFDVTKHTNKDFQDEHMD